MEENAGIRESSYKTWYVLDLKIVYLQSFSYITFADRKFDLKNAITLALFVGLPSSLFFMTVIEELVRFCVCYLLKFYFDSLSLSVLCTLEIERQASRQRSTIRPVSPNVMERKLNEYAYRTFILP